MFVHRKNIIKGYEKVEEDFTLHTLQGEYQGVKGDFIATNLDDDMLIISQDYIDAMKNIEIKPHPNKQMSESATGEYIKQLKMMNQLNQEEDQEYIEGMQLGWAYKK